MTSPGTRERLANQSTYGARQQELRIGIQMRCMDKESGFRAMAYALTQEMIGLAPDVTFVLLYKSRKRFGQFAQHANVREVLIRAPSNFLWDQIAVPYAAWKHRVDILYNTKFFVPFLSPCDVTMGLQEPSWFTRPAEYTWFDRTYQQFAIPRSIQKCAHVFPNSQFILEENRNVLGMPIPMATVTYSAAEERFKPIEDVSVVEGFRHRYDLPRKFIAVVTRAVHPGRESGPLFPGKSPEVAFRAFARVRNRIPHELIFVGRRVREYLIQAEGALADFSRVRFLDHIPFEEMHLLYNAAAIFVNPCIYEGCPNTVLQAMACGRPCIVAAAGGSADVGRGAALFARPMDDEDLARKLAQVALNEDLQAQLAARSLQRSLEFSWRKSAALTLDVLKKVAQQPRSNDRT